MPDHDRQQVETRLDDRMREIQERRTAVRENGEGMKEELADYDQHPGDTGTETFEAELDETTLIILEEEERRVKEARQALEEGRYGVCVDCGKEIPAGEYALFTIPTANEWTIILSKDAKVQSAADYKQENDAARITATPESIPIAIETFTIALNDVKGASASLDFLWDKTRVPVKLSTDDVEQVSKQLDAAVSAGTPLDPRTAYQAAAFYYDNNKDMNQAAKWIDQALAKSPDAYFMHYKKAQIQAKLGNKKEAAASAQKAIDILKKDKAPDESAIKNAQQIIDSSK
jgi:RNA polymerase-binding transcription factor DksA